MTMEINHLPSEMLLELHRRLPPSSLKMAVLVNRLWRAVGEDPTLWEGFTVTVYTKEDIRNLNIKRLKRIEEIRINPDNWDAEDWHVFFSAVSGLSRLKKIIGLGGKAEEFVEPSLFARSLTKLEDMNVCNSTYDHIKELFSEMSNGTKIKKCSLSSKNLSLLDRGLFGKVLSRLVELNLACSDTTKDQMDALFTELVNHRSLKRFQLYKKNWHDLDPRLFGSVLSRVKDVTLVDYDWELPIGDNLEALFTELSFGTELKKLELRGCVVSQMEPALVADALSKLEELSLIDILISSDQLQDLFIKMSQQTQMKRLDFHFIDLSQLEVGLFARVFAKLQCVNLHCNDITNDQLLALFTEMSHNNHLKSLIIRCSDLSSVDPEIFATAVTRLEAVTLEFNQITGDQARSLFSEISRNFEMKKINLEGNDMSSIDPEEFARALIRLEEVKLYECNISQDQAVAFFREMSQNEHLKKLDLEDDLSTVDPEILAPALTKVKEVSLRNSNLSTDQIASIFTCVLESKKTLKKLELGEIGDDAQINPETLTKVKEKLKGEFNLNSPFRFN